MTSRTTHVVAAALVLMAVPAFAQRNGEAVGPPAHVSTFGDEALATPLGQDVQVSVSHYTYTEPGDQSISIHGGKIGGDYTATLPLDRQRHWFAQIQFRGTTGSVTYDGWCSPFVITPNPTSPNGYELGEGPASPCSESGDRDWYIEGRALVGKDLLRQGWALSPYAGIGLRHLSNGTTDTPGYRTDSYLYLPGGLTFRTTIGRHPIGFTMEGDLLMHGWQTTRDAELGGGDVPATPIAPAFTIDGFTDVAFTQTSGWALRGSVNYRVAGRFSVEPYFIHWRISDSPVNYETVTFTVNRISAQEDMGFFEPMNSTNEFGVKLGLHF
jgi:hypothetical protein